MPISLAFIGLKGHYYVVTEVLADLPEVRVVAAADDNPEALKRVAGFPGTTPEAKTYLNYRELLDQHSPDIVVEAGTDRDRVDIITACAERGIHIICEKPLAQDLESLARVRKAVTQSGVRCSALLTMRCEPSYLAMRQAVAKGSVGETIQGAGQKSYRLGERPAWQKSRDTFSGIIPYIGIHVMDLFRWITGREYAEVMAYASNVAHPEIGDLEDNACI